MRRNKKHNEPAPIPRRQAENFQLRESLPALDLERGNQQVLLAIYDRLGEQLDLLHELTGNSY